MGRHKNPETLQFIEVCKKKAESLGFKVKDEFKVLRGTFWVDLTLSPYERGHDTFITLEIETEENERIYKNLDKIFVLPAEDLEKPYHHFVMIYGGRLSKGNSILMKEKARTLNVHIFENLKNEPEQLERFFRELEELKIDVPATLQRKAKINPAEAVTEAIIGAGSATPVMIVENQPFPINQATLTSGSQLPMGEQIAPPNRQLFDSKKYRQIALIPIPRRRYTVVIPGTGIALDSYYESKRNQKIFFVNLEICDYPIVVEAKVIIGDGGTVEIKIDPSEADAVQLKKFEEVLKAVNEKKGLEVYDDHSKRVHRAEGMEFSSYSPSDAWVKDVSDLAFIQTSTATRIPAPKDMVLTYEELCNIYVIKKILEEGEFSGVVKKLDLTLSTDVLKKLVALQRRKGNLEGIRFSDKATETLLGVDIPLGDVLYEVPDMVFRDSLEEIEQMVSDIGIEADVELVLVPTSSKPLKGIYPKWKKPQ